MDISNSTTLSDTFILDRAFRARCARVLARRGLPLSIASVILAAAYYWLYSIDTIKLWVGSFADHRSDAIPAIMLAVILGFASLLWYVGLHLGRLLAQARTPLSAKPGAEVDGVNMGVFTIELSDQKLTSKAEHEDYALHLAPLRAQIAGGFFFVWVSEVQLHHALVNDPKRWCNALRARQRNLDPAGWSLPTETEWARYSLSCDDYYKLLSPDEQSARPVAELQNHLVISGALVSVYVFLLYLTLHADTLVLLAIHAFMSIYVAISIKMYVRSLSLGLRRRRKGMTFSGIDIAGVTHGDTAYLVNNDGIALQRSYLLHTISWPAIDHIVPKDGLLALRAHERVTLAILPSTPDVLRALRRVGFDVPNTPWEAARSDKPWRMSA